jgi:hypothetical protein
MTTEQRTTTLFGEFWGTQYSGVTVAISHPVGSLPALNEHVIIFDSGSDNDEAQFFRSSAETS